MIKLSSRATWFHKRGFPILWFGILASVTLGALSDPGAHQPLFLVAPLIMAVFGYIMFKKLVWDLADEVYDCGDSLIVRKSGEEERIPLSNIMSVSSSTYMNPQRVTLRLVRPGRFGQDVAFAPTRPLTLNPFAINPLVEDLIVRVDRARSQRTG